MQSKVMIRRFLVIKIQYVLGFIGHIVVFIYGTSFLTNLDFDQNRLKLLMVTSWGRK